MQLLDNDRYLRIFGRVALQVSTDAFSMEGMQAGVDEELPVVEDGSEAYVTCLARIDGDVLVSLTALLSAELLSVLGVLLD